MKTPQEWLKEIKEASDKEVRHGSSVILLESDIEKIWNYALRVAMGICDEGGRTEDREMREEIKKRLL